MEHQEGIKFSSSLIFSLTNNQADAKQGALKGVQKYSSRQDSDWLFKDTTPPGFLMDFQNIQLSAGLRICVEIKLPRTPIEFKKNNTALGRILNECSEFTLLIDLEEIQLKTGP